MSGDIVELTIPDLGEGVEEGVVIALLVAPGEEVAAGQALLEIETDKVTLEIPAPRAGVVAEFLVSVDAVIHPGDAVMQFIGNDRAGTPQAVTPPAVQSASPPIPSPEPSGSAPQAMGRAALPRNDSKRRTVAAGPAARREARQLGVDVALVRGHGRGGRVTVADVRNHVRERMSAALGSARTAAVALPDLSAFGPVRRQALSRMALAAARNLTRSAQIIPHAWVSREVDITDLEAARKAFRRKKTDTAAVTMTAILVKFMADSLHEFPHFNAAFDAETNELVLRDYINIGVAVDTPDGLLVPVIRSPDTLGIDAIARELSEISRQAREGTLSAAQMRGAGCTISNLGSLGVSSLQPVVNWPEAAILGVPAAREVVQQTSGQMSNRLLLNLTLGFDHRIINGADAARFLEHLANPLGDATAFESNISAIPVPASA